MYNLTNGQIPLIGVGGISSGTDCYEKLKSGASLIQLYTALVYQGPELISNMKMADVGAELELLSTDEGSAADIPEWVNKVGHEIIESFKEDDVLHIIVKKVK